MKRIKCIVLLLLALQSYPAVSQHQAEKTIYINSTRFVNPLVERWISEYTALHPDVRILPADRSHQADVRIVAEGFREIATSQQQEAAQVGRYALLPVTNAGNDLLDGLRKKRLNRKSLEDLFFERDIWDDDEETYRSRKKYTGITVYSAESPASLTPVFATYFGYPPYRVKGKKILGDDIYLVSAVQKDTTGITFNALPYLFDLETRRLKDNLVILPLDLKKNYRDVLENPDIDQALELIENFSTDLIPVAEIRFIYQPENTEAARFLSWIRSEGQQHNQTYGFLASETGENPDTDQHLSHLIQPK